MVNILTSDLLIADIITPLAGNRPLQALVDKYGLQPGGKCAINKDQFNEFSRAIEGYPITIRAGGSTANILTTLAKLTSDMRVDFIGVAGESMYSQMIRNSLVDAHIRLIPYSVPGGKRPEAAVSYVILTPDGQRTIATYPGNAREILSPAMITPELIARCDIVMLQGSLWQRLGKEFVAALMDLHIQYHKTVWLTLPTYASFSAGKAEGFGRVLASASLILGNEEELAALYRQTADAAFGAMQQLFRQSNHIQLAFITRGAQGAVLITSDAISFIPAADIQSAEIINTLGAGDTAFAGFIAGHLKDLSNEHAARLAMVLAAEKLKENSPRLADPKESLKRGSALLAQELLTP